VGAYVDQSRVGEAAAVVAAALAPFPWREFTDDVLARRAVAAMDRHTVAAFLSGLAGTEIGDAGALEPAEADDARVAALVEVLAPQQWRDRSLIPLCMELSAVVASWLAARDSADGEDLRRFDDV
jgi:hypothetical protein